MESHSFAAYFRAYPSALKRVFVVVRFIYAPRQLSMLTSHVLADVHLLVPVNPSRKIYLHARNIHYDETIFDHLQTPFDWYLDPFCREIYKDYLTGLAHR